MVNFLFHFAVPDVENHQFVVGAAEQHFCAARQCRQRRDVATRFPFVHDFARVDRGPNLERAAGMRRGELPVAQPGDGLRSHRRRLAGDALAGRRFPGAHPAVGEQHGDAVAAGRHRQLPGGLAWDLVAPKRHPALEINRLNAAGRAGDNRARLARRDADRRDRLAAGQQVEQSVHRWRLSPPKLGHAIPAGGQGLAIGAERQRLHHVAMRQGGGGGIALRQAGVGKARGQSAGRQVVHENLVAASGGGVLAIGRNRRGINRGESKGNGPPFQFPRHLRHLALGALVDP